MRLPSAQPLPRVPRSRRDVHYQKGHPMCPKLSGIGVVVSREGDTCTVDILDEELSGCIPLTTLPPVGAIVEIESRCDLVVILDWSDGDVQPVIDDWYFTPAESPDWFEGESDSEIGTGEHVGNVAPEEPGILWNIADFDVRPGDVLTFSMLVSKLSGVDTTVQLVFCWDVHGSDPQPSTGEVVAYGPVVTVNAQFVEFAATAEVPSTFTPAAGGSATPGRARLGLKYEAAT